jgi:hypothetical protein
MRILALCSVILALPLLAQETPGPAADDPWKAVAFLEGTWGATARGNPGVAVAGTYTFARELRDHVLARHSTSNSACTGPATFDCEHADVFYIYEEASGQPLKAIYLDNEGHVIHYAVSSTGAGTAVFLSDVSRPGPQFRLIYELKGSVMTGKFQIRPPGQSDWKSYLEWSGAKQ